MTVTLSQKSYNALLDDLEKLRERNAELERKLDKEVKLSYEIEGNLYDVSKERDKIINDMAEIKRKAKAFNEIKEMINWFEDIKPCEFETQVVRVRKIIDDLERGAFNSHPNNVKLQREIVEVQEIKEEQ